MSSAIGCLVGAIVIHFINIKARDKVLASYAFGVMVTSLIVILSEYFL